MPYPSCQSAVYNFIRYVSDESATSFAVWRIWVSDNLSITPPVSANNSLSEINKQEHGTNDSTTDTSKQKTENNTKLHENLMYINEL